MINRRSLIGSIITLACAPAIVRASSLMTVKVVQDDALTIEALNECLKVAFDIPQPEFLVVNKQIVEHIMANNPFIQWALNQDPTSYKPLTYPPMTHKPLDILRDL